MKATLTALIVSALFVSLMIIGACSHPAMADSADFIHFDSGVTIYSPTNSTYNTGLLTLNLSLYSAGTLGGIDSGISMNYSIDGVCNGSVPLEAINGIHIMQEGAGIVALPELSNGSHCLTIYLEGLNQRSYEPRYLSYVNTVYFTIEGSNLTPTATPTPAPTPSPNPTPTSTPSPRLSPTNSPTQKSTSEPTQSPTPKEQESTQNTNLIYAIVGTIVIISIMVAAVFKLRRRNQ